MNEVQVDLDDVGRVRLRRAGGDEGVYTLETTEALREYFQAERDEELGRWRDPENPNMIAYEGVRAGHAVLRVMSESGGRSYSFFSLKEAQRTASSDYVSDLERLTAESAIRYYTAHEPDPEWWSAKPGEVWVISFEDAEYLGKDTPACVRKGPYKEAVFDVGAIYIEPTNSAITAGRRIWPEGEDK